MANFLDLTGLSHFWDKVKAYVDSVISTAKTTVGNYTINGKKLSTNPTISKSDVGLSNVTNDAQVKRSEMGVAGGVATLGIDSKVPAAQLPSFVDDVLEYAGTVSGVTIQSTSQSSVDAVYYDTTHKSFCGKKGESYYNNWSTVGKEALPANSFGTILGTTITPYSNKIYVDTSKNKTYRWSGTYLVQLDSGLTLGETSSTAFAGNRGKALETWKASLVNKYALTLGNSGDVTPSETDVYINFNYFDVNNPTSSGSQSISVPAATTSKAGVMSKSDKSKLDWLSNTPDATDTVAGKVKLGSGTVQAKDAQLPSAESGKTYPIQKNSNGQLVVNVPWQNTQGSDTKVTQNAVGSTNGAFNILLAQTAGNTSAETGSVNKASGLTYNPSTKALSTGGAVTASGAITGSSIKKSGGTSSQILMADGSVATSIQTGDIDALFSQK